MYRTKLKKVSRDSPDMELRRRLTKLGCPRSRDLAGQKGAGQPIRPRREL